jgi:hypothetical protein
MNDRFHISFVEIDPNFNTIADGVGNLGGDESKAIDLIASFKGLTDKFEAEILVDFLFIWLIFRNLEDKSSTFLILFIFPFRFDSLPEKLDRVNPLERTLYLVSKSHKEYAFCL